MRIKCPSAELQFAEPCSIAYRSIRKKERLDIKVVNTCVNAGYKLDQFQRIPRSAGRQTGTGQKKRKVELIDPDAERHLYTSFVTAANSITQLYAQAQQQQRNVSAGASRQTLARLVHWLRSAYPNEESIPKAELMHFLHQEYESLEGCETAVPVPQMFPAVQGHHLQPGTQTEDAAMENVRQPSLHSSSRI